MNKYNIKVGDYVETIDDGIGYVTSVGYGDFKWMIVKPRNTPSAAGAGAETSASFDTIEIVYKRIGENEFRGYEKFQPISKYNQNGLITYTDKINELIDHINAIQERLNEDDSTRTN